MDFVPCVKWVPRGAAKESPIKVELTREELKQLIREARPQDSDCDDELQASEDENEIDRYDFENYDADDSHNNAVGIGSIALFEDNERDAHINIPGMDDEDTDDEDDIIKPNDNLILVGKGFRDNSCMENIEIHVYNDDEGDMYVHHDIMVDSCPLSFELISVETEVGLSNFIAAGLMSSCICLYDINLINPAKPQAKLGSKQKNAEKGHTDAILDLSWNKSYPHILASSSVDKTVVLWDLETVTLSNKFNEYNGMVENIQWEVDPGHCLLSTDSTGSVKLIDCRLCNTTKEWTVKGEALVGRWVHNQPYHFLVGTSKGKIFNFDTRTNSPIFKFKGHERDITALSSIDGYQGLLVSTCVEGDLNVWDVNSDPKRLVFNKSLNVEQLHSLDLNPDNPLIAAVGGAKKKGSYFSVLNLNKKNALNDILNFRRTSS